jgi:hypothetical protein
VKDSMSKTATRKLPRREGIVASEETASSFSVHQLLCKTATTVPCLVLTYVQTKALL